MRAGPIRGEGMGGARSSGVGVVRVSGDIVFIAISWPRMAPPHLGSG